MGGLDPEVDRIESWGGLEPFLRILFVDPFVPPRELPSIMGNCSELGGSTSVFTLVTLPRLCVNRGDMKVMGRLPPGVAVSAS